MGQLKKFNNFILNSIGKSKWFIYTLCVYTVLENKLYTWYIIRCCSICYHGLRYLLLHTARNVKHLPCFIWRIGQPHWICTIDHFILTAYLYFCTSSSSIYYPCISVLSPILFLFILSLLCTEAHIVHSAPPPFGHIQYWGHVRTTQSPLVHSLELFTTNTFRWKIRMRKCTKRFAVWLKWII